MFSAKNYGLPKDLIEAAKRVHEKQLMEYDEDGHINNPPKGMDKGTKEKRKEAADLGLKGPHLEGEGKLPKKNKKLPPLPVRKPKNEEVQFTEEELAEAFAIFLEENFHVEMLTEEDLDYVFENEFPQWLEETAAATRIKSRQQQKPGMTVSDVAKKVFFPFADKDKPSARSNFNDMGNAPVIKKIPTGQHELDAGRPTSKSTAKPEPAPAANTPAKPRKQVSRPAPKPQSFGALLRKVGGNAPATSDTAAGRRKIKLLDARARARTAARDASGRGQPSWAKKAFTSEN